MRLLAPLTLLAAACLVAGAQTVVDDDDGARATPPTGVAVAFGSGTASRGAPVTVSPVAPLPSSPGAAGAVRRVLIGYSRQRRAIIAYEVGDPRLPSVLVVGCIHGNETAGVPITRWLVAHAHGLHRVHLWIVPVLNPDGAALHMRQDAGGVDLNRNFPYQWIAANRGTPQDSGPQALSEPEAQALARLARSARPTYGVWFHQALAVVDDSQGPPAVEALFSRSLNLPMRRLTDYRGSAVGWEDQLRPHSAFVVELPAGSLSRGNIRSAALAVVSADRLAGAR